MPSKINFSLRRSFNDCAVVDGFRCGSEGEWMSILSNVLPVPLPEQGGVGCADHR